MGQRTLLAMAVLRLVVRVSVEPAQERARSPEPRVRRALELMEQRMTERWTVASLARAVGVSRAVFARLFLAEMKTSPLRYLTGRRIRKAAQLLIETDEKLVTVAALVGYESEFSFSRVFRRHTGEAPGSFRRRVRSAFVSPVTSLRAAA